RNGSRGSSLSSPRGLPSRMLELARAAPAMPWSRSRVRTTSSIAGKSDAVSSEVLDSFYFASRGEGAPMQKHAAATAWLCPESPLVIRSISRGAVRHVDGARDNLRATKITCYIALKYGGGYD